MSNVSKYWPSMLGNFKFNWRINLLNYHTKNLYSSILHIDTLVRVTKYAAKATFNQGVFVFEGNLGFCIKLRSQTHLLHCLETKLLFLQSQSDKTVNSLEKMQCFRVLSSECN